MPARVGARRRGVDGAGSGAGVADRAMADETAVVWSDVWCCVKSTSKGRRRRDRATIEGGDGGRPTPWNWCLRGVCGRATLGRSLAILGPSGSGKTTLLTAIGGQLKRSRNLWISGRIDAPDHSVAFVPQDTPFFSNLTVRETLDFVCAMEGNGGDDCAAKVDAVVRKLGLGACLDTLVGGDTGGHAVRGISGGERRRLSIACEILRTDDPDGDVLTLLVADEPTTGLDTFQAGKVVEHLVSIARRREAIVMMSIHQPRSTIFHALDDILLLGPGGNVCFVGAASDALPHFEKLGHACPPHTNPAEFLLDLVSLDTTSDASEAASWRRIRSLAEVWARRDPPPPMPTVQAPPQSKAPPPKGGQPAGGGRRRRRGVAALAQLRLLLGRGFTQARRETYVHRTRAVGTALLALAFGCCHAKLGLGQRSIRRRAAVMMQVSSMRSIDRSLTGQAPSMRMATH